MRILLAGGGSAGHTSPMIATADALRRRDPDAEIWCVGTERGLETTVVPAAGYRLELIPPVPLPRRVGADLLKVPWRLRRSVRAAREIFERLRPDVVVGFGGYVSVPVYLAARRAGLPLVVHEGNPVPGVANKVGARWCTDRVATAFPDTPLPHATFVGLPIRRAISALDRAGLRQEARRFFGLRSDLPTVLVTGGSQGARRINQAVSGARSDLAAAGVQVLHAQGAKGELAPVEQGEGEPPYVLVPYLDRMDLAYSAADVAVARAGANSVVEAASIGLPTVFVPLPHGNGEQRLNAEPVVEAGGGLLVDDAQFTADWVRDHLAPLAADAERLQRMGAAGAGLMRRDADEALADMIEEAAR